MIGINSTNVLVVGSGPVGLSTAIQAKIRNPNLNITILDEYEKYKRKQKLRLDPSSFSEMPNHKELNKIIENFNPTLPRKIFNVLTVNNLEFFYLKTRLDKIFLYNFYIVL